MVTSEEKMQIVINNYFQTECDVNTSIRQAFEKGFRLGVKKGLSIQSEIKPPKWVAEDKYIKNKFAAFLPHCPQCNAEITTGQCYCMICGQHIDWSEDDE